MRAADPAPTPPLHINLHGRGPIMGSTGTASNGAESRGRLAALTGTASGAGGDAAPLIIIGSTASQNLVSCLLCLSAAEAWFADLATLLADQPGIASSICRASACIA